MVYDASLGYDDAMPDAQENWICNLDADEWIEFMEKYSDYCAKFRIRIAGTNATPLDSETWLFDYFAEHVYPDLGAMDADALYEQQRDANL